MDVDVYDCRQIVAASPLPEKKKRGRKKKETQNTQIRTKGVGRPRKTTVAKSPKSRKQKIPITLPFSRAKSAMQRTAKTVAKQKAPKTAKTTVKKTSAQKKSSADKTVDHTTQLLIDARKRLLEDKNLLAQQIHSVDAEDRRKKTFHVVGVSSEDTPSSSLNHGNHFYTTKKTFIDALKNSIAVNSVSDNSAESPEFYVYVRPVIKKVTDPSLVSILKEYINM